MKNYKLLGILSIIPFVTSCHGFIISKEEGVKAINDITNFYNEGKVGYDKFTYFYNHKLSYTENEIEEKVIFDRGAKFCYSYVITKGEHPSVLEKWCYVKDNRIFDCILENSQKEDGQFAFKSAHPDRHDKAFLEYSDEEWNFLENELLSNGVNKLFKQNLDKMKELSDGDNQVEYSSWNKQTSIAVELKNAEYVYKCNVDNFKLEEVVYQNKELYENFSVNYERAQITYLNA